MNDALRALAAIAAEQHEIVSRVQVAEAGLTTWALGRHVRAGTLVAVGPHSWRFAGTALTWRGQLQAGVFDLGSAALVAGRAALLLLGVDVAAPAPLEFVVPRAQRSRTTAGVVRSGAAPGAVERCTVDGLPCVSATLAVLQVARFGDRVETTNALDNAVRLRLTTPDLVHQALAERRRRGVAGVALLDDVLLDAGVQSWLERRFLALVRAAGLPVPALQRVYRRGSRHVARVDFDFAPLPVVVEVGGQKGYLTRRERQRQERRRNELQLLGKVAYFFTYEDVTGDEAYVLRTLHSALGRAA